MHRHHQWASSPERSGVGRVQHVETVCQDPRGQVDREPHPGTLGDKAMEVDVTSGTLPWASNVINVQLEISVELSEA